METKTDVLEIEATEETPYIFFDKNKGEILIKGVSIPENTVEFYWKFNREFSEYTANPAPKKTNDKQKLNGKFLILPNFNLFRLLRYMNSSTSQVITNMLRTFDQMIGLKTKIEINWLYENEDLEMKELGEFYQKIMKGTINLQGVDTF